MDVYQEYKVEDHLSLKALTTEFTEIFNKIQPKAANRRCFKQRSERAQSNHSKGE